MHVPVIISVPVLLAVHFVLYTGYNKDFLLLLLSLYGYHKKKYMVSVLDKVVNRGSLQHTCICLRSLDRNCKI